MLKQLLFPAKPDGTATSAMLLIARIVFGILLMNHGIQKWTITFKSCRPFSLTRWV